MNCDNCGKHLVADKGNDIGTGNCPKIVCDECKDNFNREIDNLLDDVLRDM